MKILKQLKSDKKQYRTRNSNKPTTEQTKTVQNWNQTKNNIEQETATTTTEQTKTAQKRLKTPKLKKENK